MDDRRLRVLVACEFSGIVRDAFIKEGHDAISCDLLPTESPGPHIQEDCLKEAYSGKYDIMIAHPPCTHLAVAGARWFYKKEKEQWEALAFVKSLMDAPVPRICIENPKSIISTRIRRPDQIINPWQYGHGEMKMTCLWLKGLPRLEPTDIVAGRVQRIHMVPDTKNQAKIRSIFYPGIAAAMAKQWGDISHGQTTL